MQISSDLKLKDVEDILPWYSEVNPDKTVEIANYMRDQAVKGEQIFYQKHFNQFTMSLLFCVILCFIDFLGLVFALIRVRKH